MDKMIGFQYSTSRSVMIDTENEIIETEVLMTVLDDRDKNEAICVIVGIDNSSVNDFIKGHYYELIKERLEKYIKEISPDPPDIEDDKRYFAIPIGELELKDFKPIKKDEK